MATFRSQEILDIIKTATVPWSIINYFAQEQIAAQRMYPSVEVNNVKPEFSTEEKDITELKNKFAVTIFARYGGDRARTTEELRTAEQNIIGVLTAATLDADEDLTVGKVVLEQRDFTRGPIRINPKNVNAIQSVLTIEIIEVQATETGVPLGGQNTITIGTIVTAQVYNKPPEPQNENFESVYNAARIRTKLFPINEDHQFFFEIGFTTARDTELRALAQARAKITAVFFRNGVGENKIGYVSRVSNGAPFNGVETLDVMMELIN